MPSKWKCGTIVSLLLLALVSFELALLLASNYFKLFFCGLLTCVFAYHYGSNLICFWFSLLESDTLAKVNANSSFVSAVLYYYYIFSNLEKFNAKATHNRTLEYMFLNV